MNLLWVKAVDRYAQGHNLIVGQLPRPIASTDWNAFAQREEKDKKWIGRCQLPGAKHFAYGPDEATVKAQLEQTVRDWFFKASEIPVVPK